MYLIHGFSVNAPVFCASLPSPVVEIDVQTNSEPRIFESASRKSRSRLLAQFWCTSPVITIGFAIWRVSMKSSSLSRETV